MSRKNSMQVWGRCRVNGRGAKLLQQSLLMADSNSTTPMVHHRALLAFLLLDPRPPSACQFVHLTPACSLLAPVSFVDLVQQNGGGQLEPHQRRPVRQASGRSEAVWAAAHCGQGDRGASSQAGSRGGSCFR